MQAAVQQMLIVNNAEYQIDVSKLNTEIAKLQDELQKEKDKSAKVVTMHPCTVTSGANNRPLSSRTPARQANRRYAPINDPTRAIQTGNAPLPNGEHRARAQ